MSLVSWEGPHFPHTPPSHRLLQFFLLLHRPLGRLHWLDENGVTRGRHRVRVPRLLTANIY